MPIIDTVSSGVVMFYLLLSGGLTFAAGMTLLYVYRRAVLRLMQPISAAAAAAAAVGRLDRAADDRIVAERPLPLRRLAPAMIAKAPLRSPTLLAARYAYIRSAITHLIAGAAFSGVATTLWMTFADLEFLPVRTLTVFWAHFWPVVLVLFLLWGPDRWCRARALGGYLAILAALCAAAGLIGAEPIELGRVSLSAPPDHAAFAIGPLDGLRLPGWTNPLFLWATMALPTLYLLLFLNGRVRAVGPILLIFFLIVSTGAHLSLVLLSVPTVMEQVARFAPQLGLSEDVALAGVLVGFPLAGMLLFAFPAWHITAWLSRRYEAKGFSYQTLVFDLIWILAAISLCGDLIQQRGAVGWAGLGAFAAYRAVAAIGLRPLPARAKTNPPARILLLRVFGHAARMQRLLELLVARWSFAGPIWLIGAPDLASAALDPDEFFDFVRGQLARRFIHSADELDRQLATSDLEPDPDGRFRVKEFFCGGTIWQEAVRRLMQDSDMVAMDLRGFSDKNQGCLFELQALLDSVPATRIALLIDSTTATEFLRETLARCWCRLDRDSPNRATGPVREVVTVLDVGADNVAAVRALIRMADAALCDAAGRRSEFEADEHHRRIVRIPSQLEAEFPDKA